jgi:RNA recognition motif-containing protein
VTKLFVGNFPFATTEDQLHQLFSECGDVRAVKIITDREHGGSKGFGFVDLPDLPTAQAAVLRFHKAKMSGRELIVEIAKPRPTGKSK